MLFVQVEIEILVVLYSIACGLAHHTLQYNLCEELALPLGAHHN